MDILEKISTKIIRKSKYTYGDMLNLLGLNARYLNSSKGCRIIVYHGICQKNPFQFNTLFITKKRFEEHLRYYKKYFNVITLNDYYEQKFSKKQFNICLTFDDGFSNNYNYVLPLLETYKLPATFFVSAIRDAGYEFLWNDMLSISSKIGPAKITFKEIEYYKNRNNKYIDKNKISLAEKLRLEEFEPKDELIHILNRLVPKWQNTEDEYWCQMTTKQIELLSKSSYATIGSHGYYHNDLSKISSANAYNEMEKSKQYLENIVDKEITSIAFPYGAYNQQVLTSAQQIGYRQLLTTNFSNLNDAANQLLKERLIINPFISTANQMRANIKGSYE